MAIHLEELFPIEIERLIARSAPLVLPFGTIEWHSHHLPVGLDGLVAQRVAEKLAEAADAVMAPVSYWAVDGVPFPYTLALPLEQVEPLLETLLKQYVSMGFQTLVIFTAHFGLGQTLATKRAALIEMQRSIATILPLTTYDLVADFYSGDHAGIGETSLMMAFRPDLVRLGDWPADKTLPGVIGDDPRSKASVELGLDISNRTALRCSQLVASFREGRIDRNEWIETLRIVVEILEITLQLRKSLPRDQVPLVTTFEYLNGWNAIGEGALLEAQMQFRAKVESLRLVEAREKKELP